MAIKIKGEVVITNTEDLDIYGSATIGGHSYFNGTFLYGDNKEMIDHGDAWLRLNQNGDFTSGTYTPGKLRADGGYQISGSFVIDSDKKLVNIADGSGELGLSGSTLSLSIGGTAQDTQNLGDMFETISVSVTANEDEGDAPGGGAFNVSDTDSTTCSSGTLMFTGLEDVHLSYNTNIEGQLEGACKCSGVGTGTLTVIAIAHYFPMTGSDGFAVCKCTGVCIG